MSHNNWETQTRKADGEFTFRIGRRIFEKALKAATEAIKKNPKDVAKFSKGGSYKDLRKDTKGNDNVEVHHMPANSVSPLSKGKGPCVVIDKKDHARTASYGRKSNAEKHRRKQKQLIEKDKFMEAEYMDIQKLLNKFGSKYAKAILEKLEYDKQLETKGEIND